MIFFYGKIDTVKFIDWDIQWYIKIAETTPYINKNLPQPFVYRILGPYLVGMLNLFQHKELLNENFYFFTIILSLFLTVLYFHFIKKMEIEDKFAFITTLFFIFNKWAFGFTVWDYFQVNDIISVICIILLFLFAKVNWIKFGIILLLGILSKETTIIMIPVVFLYLIEKKVNYKKIIIATLPAIILFLFFRITIRPTSGRTLLQAFLFWHRKIYNIDFWLRIFINTFLPFSIFPIIFSKDFYNFISQNKYALLYVLCIFLTTLFGSSNERLFAPAFIIFYLFIAKILQKYFKNLSAFYFLPITFLSSLHHLYARFALPNKNWTIIFSIISLFLTCLLGIIYKIKYENNR